MRAQAALRHTIGWILSGLTLLPLWPGRVSAAPAHEAPASAHPQEDAAQATQLASSRAVILFRSAQILLKAHQYKAARVMLQYAVEQAAAGHVPAEDQSFMYYLKGAAERGAGLDTQAIASYEKALQLSQRHPEFRLDLANAMLGSDRLVEARRELEHGLLLGFSNTQDVSDAKTLLTRAKTEYLRERFSAYVSLSFGYDSNVLTGTNGPCSEANCTGTASVPADPSNLAQIQAARANPTNPTALKSLYLVPVSRREWDLPTTLQLDFSARVLATRTTSLWYEYHFSQYLLASVAYDHDAYNFQEHSFPVYLNWKPKPWLFIRPTIEGFVNFSGLQTFSPYQGGGRGMLELGFSESHIWTTRLLYMNLIRHSFDRIQDGYLDGDRQDIRAQQEMMIFSNRVRLRGQLGYRFRYEQSGERDTRASPGASPVPMVIPAGLPGAAGGPALTLGGVDYVDPIGYMGHEASTRWRLQVPLGISFTAGASYEYRSFVAPSRVSVFRYIEGMPGVAPFALPTLLRRIDSLVTGDFSVRKDLPRGFAVELSYSVMKNYSNLATWIENWNFIKHTAVATFTYSF